jgi:HSP20 family protein
MSRRSDPFEDIEELLDVVTGGLEPTGGRGLPVDVVDAGDEFVVVADLPGYDRDDVSVTLPDETTLAVAAGRDTDIEAERYVTRESQRGSISRRVGLPEPVAETETGATLEEGVLTVTLPKQTGSGDGTEIPVE